MLYSAGLPRAKPKADFKFSMLPDALSRRTDLSQGSKVLFALILSFSRGSGGACWLTNESLAERTGLCSEQVRRLLRRLELAGLIRRKMVTSVRREIRATWRPDAMYPPEQMSGYIEPGPGIPSVGARGIHSLSPNEKGEETIRVRVFDPGEEEIPPQEVAQQIWALLGKP